MSTSNSAVPSNVEQLGEWIHALEGEHFEFKEARMRFSFDELAIYCCAMANEGVLDLIHREQVVPAVWYEHLRRLVDLGVVETLGRGRGTRYLLSRRFYVMTGRAGAYTRRRGLDRDQNKALLLGHVRQAGEKGSPMSELQQVVPALSRKHVKGIMDELKREDRVRLTGTRRGSRWVAVGD